MTPPVPGALSGAASDAVPATSSPSAALAAPHAGPGTVPATTSDPPAGRHSPSLGSLRKGQRGVVTGLDETAVATPLPAGELERRMIEMGLIEGACVEILHEGFPGADPLAVRINDHTLALRRAEAHAVLVTLG